MPGFSYKGRLSNGDITQGSVDASDENTVAKMLSARAIIPIEILPNERLEQSTEKTTQAINFLTPNVSLDELVIFSPHAFLFPKQIHFGICIFFS